MNYKMPRLTVIIDPELEMEEIPDWMGDKKFEWISTSSSTEMRVVYNFYINEPVVVTPRDLEWADIPYSDYCMSVFRGKQDEILENYMQVTETRNIAFIKKNGNYSYVALTPKRKL